MTRKMTNDNQEDAHDDWKKKMTTRKTAMMT